VSHSHDLLKLTKVAGLGDEHRERVRSDSDFEANWEVVKFWSEQSRYRKHTRESARALLVAISDRHHGVITWIKLHW
jgi:hypothetical protein